MKTEELKALDDEALVRLAVADRDGSRGSAAANELLGRYHGRVYAWCWRQVRQRELALDLAQDAMLQAYRGLDGYSGAGPFAGWMFVIVRNRCRTALRRPSLVREENVELEALEDSSGDVLEGVAARLDQERVLTLMRRALTSLEQDALWLRAMEGMPVEEITRRLEVEGSSGARGLLQTARRKLRAALRESGPAGGESS